MVGDECGVPVLGDVERRCVGECFKVGMLAARPWKDATQPHCPDRFVALSATSLNPNSLSSSHDACALSSRCMRTLTLRLDILG